MEKMMNYIFNNFNRVETDLRSVGKMALINRRSINKLNAVAGLTIITLTTLVHSNTKRIEELEAEIKELKGE